jgi:hypothetical protein
MKKIKLYEEFTGIESVTETFSNGSIEELHFETDAKKAEKLKLAIGASHGMVTNKTKIEDADYSLNRFRKEIGFGNKDEKYTGVFLPGSYSAAISKLGDGPHAKAVKKIKWNQKKYDQWLEDVASNDGWKNAYDMAQNASSEPGLINWVKKEFRGDDPLQRIQWDIEGFSESVVTEANTNENRLAKAINALAGLVLTRDDEKISELWLKLDDFVYDRELEIPAVSDMGFAIEAWQDGHGSTSGFKKLQKELLKLAKDLKAGKVKMSDFEIQLDEGLSKSNIKKQIKEISTQIDKEEGGDGEPLTNETLQALEDELARLESMLESNVNEGNKVTFTLDDGGLDDKFLSDKGLSRNLDYKEDGKDSYYVLPKRDFDRLQDWADSSGYDTDEVIDVIDESVINEAKSLNRAEMTDLLDKHLNFLRTSEEFDGATGGIWTSAENGETLSGSRIFDYYSESSKYEFGVLNKFAKLLSKNGWYAEFYDPGTVMIWEE